MQTRIGIITQSLERAEIGHPGLTRLEVVDCMHARKARMAELSDAFIALPGGLGTLEELFEVWTWGQLGYHNKPLGLLDVNGFYSKLDEFLDHLVSERFVRSPHRATPRHAEAWRVAERIIGAAAPMATERHA